ncbi:MAG: DMT family transporter [Pseudomonadota bacterium]
MTDTTATAPARQALPAYGFMLLFGVTLFWGANWPGMKIALGELPVWWFRTMSVGAGAFGLLAIALISVRSIRMPLAEIPKLVVVSIFAIMGWHVFAAYGVTLMPAGRASIIAFTMPVWASLMGSVLLNEPFTRYKVAGLVLGLGGLAVLMGEDLIILGTAPIGALFMLGAAVSWGFGTVLFKRFTWSAPVSVMVGWQLFAAMVPIFVVAVITEPVPDMTALSWETIIALAYLFTLPMVFCQWAYFKVVTIFPAAIAAMGTLAVPIVGVYSSALILGEPVGWQELASLVLICGALASVLVVPSLIETRPRALGWLTDPI